MNHNRIIVWFRKDLRILDHPAFWEASKRGEVIPVYIWSPEEEKEHQLAEASKWWLHYSLKAFSERLVQQGLQLIIRQGDSLSVLKEILCESQAKAVYFNERYEPLIRKRDQQIKSILMAENIQVKSFHGNLLFDPESIANHQGHPYKVFTPFWKHCIKKSIPAPLPLPSNIYSSKKKLYSLEVDDLGLVSGIQWHKKLLRYWTPGEIGAMDQWQFFINEKMVDYNSKRDDLEQYHVSRLSPHLAFGELSPRWIWYNLLNYEMNERADHGASFIRQLIWREFSYHQLINNPECIGTSIRSEYIHFPWEDDENLLLLWKKGKTGYPLVDAGMRELWETGYMHNRVRMVVASFLVKHLLIPWTKGADWFKETLVDFDLANNTMGWQWVSGCGVDAAPYFRIFNPVLQGEKFDRDGYYVRRWVPELAAIPNQYIHQPWKAPKEMLYGLGIVLGRTYPYPIIEHSYARQRALDAYHSIQNAKVHISVAGQ